MVLNGKIVYMSLLHILLVRIGKSMVNFIEICTSIHIIFNACLSIRRSFLSSLKVSLTGGKGVLRLIPKTILSSDRVPTI